MLPLLPLHIALNALLLLRGVFLGEAGAMLLELRDALLGLRRVLIRRRAIQAQRVVSVAGLAARIDWSVSGVLGRRSKIRATPPPAPFTQAQTSPTNCPSPMS
jgi:hypothetical protein